MEEYSGKEARAVELKRLIGVSRASLMAGDERILSLRSKEAEVGGSPTRASQETP